MYYTMLYSAAVSEITVLFWAEPWIFSLPLLSLFCLRWWLVSDLPLPVLISPLESFSIIVSPPVLLRRGSEKLVGWSLASHQCGITTVICLLTTVVTSRVSTDKAKSKFSLTIYYPSNAFSLSSSHYNWIILPRSSRFIFFSQGKTTYHLCLQFSSAPYFVSNDRQDFSRLPKRPISNWWIAQQQNDLPTWTKRITQSTCAMLQGLATREVTSRELMWQWFANIWKEGKRTNRSCHYFLLGEEFPVQTSSRFNFLECYLWKAVIPTCSEAELMADGICRKITMPSRCQAASATEVPAALLSFQVASSNFRIPNVMLFR